MDEKKRLLRGLLVLGGTAAVLAFVTLVWQPSCLILKYTGFYCAGCGGQRMLSSLLEGDLLSAFRRNPYLFCLIPCAAGYCLWEFFRYVRGKSPLFRKRPVQAALWAALLLAAVFTVLRNLPGVDFLGPELP